MEFRRAYDPFRALDGAWKLVKLRPMVLLLGAFVLLISDCSGSSFEYHEERDFPEVLREVVLPPLAMLACVLGIVLFLLGSLVRCGLATAVERVALTGEEQGGDLFKSRGRLLSMVLTQLLSILLYLLAALPFLAIMALVAAIGGTMADAAEAAIAFGFLAALVCLPGYIYVVLGFTLAPQAVAFEGVGPIAAVLRSWSLVAGNRLWLFWYLLVSFVTTLVAFCCCILPGLPMTMAWSLAGHEAYLRLIRDDQEDWVVDGGAGAPLRCAGERVGSWP